MFNRWGEFFEADDGRKSMTRLLCFLSFGPASYIAVVTKDPDIFAWYISAFVFGYVTGKATDILSKPKGDAYVRSTETSTTENITVAKK